LLGLLTYYLPIASQLTLVVVVFVLKMLTVNPVRFDPENVGDEYEEDLNGSAALIAVTRTDAFADVAVPAEVLTVSPVTATPVVAFATGVMSTDPLEMFDAEIIPDPVTFTKVTLLVVATA
jgi:hypothetical protein